MDSPRQNPRDLKDHRPPPSPSTSPNSSSTSSNSSNTNGPLSAPPSSSCLPPLTPKSNPTPTTPNPYPTTFIQADTQSFKQVVQMLTGSAETTAKRSTQTQTFPLNSNFTPAQPQKSQIPPINRSTKKPAFKLYERRSSMKNLKMISPLIPSFPNCPSPTASFRQRHHHQPEILSPSILDFPKLVISPVTPLSPDPFRTRSPSQLGISPEDRAIAEKGFYLHPSPRPTTPRDAEPPKLLPLFPLTSPRMESSAAAAAVAESS